MTAIAALARELVKYKFVDSETSCVSSDTCPVLPATLLTGADGGTDQLRLPAPSVISTFPGAPSRSGKVHTVL